MRTVGDNQAIVPARLVRSGGPYLCIYIADNTEFDDSDYRDKPMGFPEPGERYPVVFPAA